MKKILIFHPTIAPYRIDFFNDLYTSFNTRICLEYRNLKDQKFDYDKIESQFKFTPIYKQDSSNNKLECFYWKHLDEFEPDVVLAGEYGFGTILILMHRFVKRKKYKVISICDDSYNMVAENNDFSLKHRIARKFIVPLLDELILLESRDTHWYKEHYNKGFFFPIIKSDDKARLEYQKVLSRSQEIADKYKLKNKKVILFVGRLVKLKNVVSAIKAFSKVDQNRENVFVIVGDGPEKDNLMKLSCDLDLNIIFTGRLEGDALNVWYNIAQVFILPSYQEAFGAVTNEALLAGCKGLISNKAGSQCLIENGVNGYTFNPMDIDDISNKMLKCLGEVPIFDIIKLKENRMLLTYSNCINGVISLINEI